MTENVKDAVGENEFSGSFFPDLSSHEVTEESVTKWQ
jgi:hypothetical protein